MSTTRHAVLAQAGARLDRLPIDRWHYMITTLITAGLFIDLFDLYASGGILAAMVQSGWSTIGVNATYLAVSFAGLTVGAWGSGVLGDRLGRRFCYRMDLALYGCSAIAAVFAPNMATLIGLRFIMGIALGAEVVVSYATLAEFMPAAQRGRWVACMSLIANCGFFASLALAYFLIPALGWKAMFAVTGTAALVVGFARRWVPESPRWLESVGRVQEADALLNAIEATVARRHVLPPVPAAPANGPLDKPSAVPITVLFRQPVIGRTLIGILITVTVGITLYGFLQWLPTLFVKRGLAFGSSLQIVMLMALGLTTGTAIGMVLSDRLGRKPTIVGFSLLAAAIGVGVIFAAGPLFVVMNVALATCLGITHTVSYSVYVPELFETRYRLRGTGVCGAAGRLASVLVQFVIVSLYGAGGLPAIVALLVAVLVLEAVVIQIFGVETTKTPLEAIGAAARDIGAGALGPVATAGVPHASRT